MSRCKDCNAELLQVTYPSGKLVWVDAEQVLVVQLMEGRPPKVEETHVGHRLHDQSCPGPRKVNSEQRALPW